MARQRVGVLISGRGSNLQALIDAAADPAYPAEIVHVISNRPEGNMAFRRISSPALNELARTPVTDSSTSVTAAHETPHRDVRPPESPGHLA